MIRRILWFAAAVLSIAVWFPGFARADAVQVLDGGATASSVMAVPQHASLHLQSPFFDHTGRSFDRKEFLGSFGSDGLVTSVRILGDRARFRAALRDGDSDDGPADPAPVPEPASLILLGAGLLASWRGVRHRVRRVLIS